MQVSPKEVRLLGQAIEHWQAEGLVSGEQANALRDSLEVSVFDWKRVAKYAFWLALACIVIAVSAVLADRWLMQLFERLFSASDWVKCLAFAVIAAVLYGLGVRRKYRWPDKRFSNEAIFFLGVIATAVAIGFLGEAISSGSDHFSLLLLLAAVLYGLLGLWFPSTLVWVFALLSLGSWFGAETGYLSGWGAYYLGMNVPLRFVFFGLVLILAGSINLYTRFFEFFWDGTHKAIFFGILALSFWYLGTRAERIWQMSALSRLAGEREEPGPR